MASVVIPPDPTVLELLSLEVDTSVNLITAFALTISPEFSQYGQPFALLCLFGTGMRKWVKRCRTVFS